MIAVIFELKPKAAKASHYFDIADRLKPMLENIDGFVSIERFQCLSDTGRYLSLSFWHDEESVTAWRNTQQHRQAQAAGRQEIFDYYRLRVANVVRDYTLTDREQAPKDSGLFFNKCISTNTP